MLWSSKQNHVQSHMQETHETNTLLNKEGMKNNEFALPNKAVIIHSRIEVIYLFFSHFFFLYTFDSMFLTWPMCVRMFMFMWKRRKWGKCDQRHNPLTNTSTHFWDYNDFIYYHSLAQYEWGPWKCVPVSSSKSRLLLLLVLPEAIPPTTPLCTIFSALRLNNEWSHTLSGQATWNQTMIDNTVKQSG